MRAALLDTKSDLPQRVEWQQKGLLAAAAANVAQTGSDRHNLRQLSYCAGIFLINYELF